ncbi:MAG: M28 family peptidase [Candidatus Omnitrophica bacterium]|nr:M28 family peptidase [Candidatus Omnitrophota bacterium]
MEPSCLAQAVRSDRVLASLQALEGERHPATSPEHLHAATQYVIEQWRASQLTVDSHEFLYLGERFVNWIARPASCPSSGPRLILGAHLDTVPGTPGADDNASGVAALLEISRVIADGSWNLPIECVLFSLEELGMIGSTHYAKMLRRTHAPVLGMCALEMIGFTESQGLQRYPWFLQGRYPSTGTFIGLAANARSRALLSTVAEAMRTVPSLPVETIMIPGSGWMVPESRLSDHAPFWDQGYPALLVTDTSFFRNPHYHQAGDTVETLDLAFLTKVTQGLVTAIEKLCR